MDLFGEVDDDAGQAYVHLDIAWVLERQGDYGRALGHGCSPPGT